MERDPQRIRGAWVFRGTRSPVAALFENLEDGIALAEFVDLFPGVTQKQARSVLEQSLGHGFIRDEWWRLADASRSMRRQAGTCS